jgi:NAD(P)-dependent dehydrogenase (short-subunit alcohol dehydrogenase family)
VTVTVVTGAGRGLGRAIVEGLLAHGATVVAVCRPGGTRLESADERLLVVDGDVSVEADCARVVAATLDRFGRLDALVNNAAIAHAPFPLLHDTDPATIAADDWRRIFAVNVHGTFLMSRAAVEPMLAAGWGRVINVSTSKSSMLAPGVLPYGPSKAAVEAMTVGWARHLEGTGVTVNEVLPGGPAGPPSADKHWWAPGARTWPASIMVPPLRWLVSRASDGVTGMRVVARLWDPSLPDDAAARGASFPAGWPLGAEDTAQPPA